MQLGAGARRARVPSEYLRPVHRSVRQHKQSTHMHCTRSVSACTIS